MVKEVVGNGGLVLDFTVLDGESFSIAANSFEQTENNQYTYLEQSNNSTRYPGSITISTHKRSTATAEFMVLSNEALNFFLRLQQNNIRFILKINYSNTKNFSLFDCYIQSFSPIQKFSVSDASLDPATMEINYDILTLDTL